MTEINSLTNTVVRLTASVAWWNTALIVMMVVAALAATGLVVSQYVAFKQAEKLVEAQEQLSAAKDAQLARELKEKTNKLPKPTSEQRPQRLRPQRQMNEY